MSKQQAVKQQEEKKQEIVLTTAAGNPIVPTTLSMDYLAQDARRGSQNVNQEDKATPLITILQSNSPQCKKSDGKFIEGASEGKIFNNVTNEVYDGEVGILVVPAYFEKIFIEWKPNRGGFVAMHDFNTKLKEQVVVTPVKQPDGSTKDLPLLPNGNLFIGTHQHYVLILKQDGSFEAAVLPMVSSALKASRKWNTLIDQVTLTDSEGKAFIPARFYMVYKLTTKAMQKDQNSWYTWGVEPAGAVPNRRLYEAAKAFETAICAGSVKVKQDAEQAEATTSTDNSEM